MSEERSFQVGDEVVVLPCENDEGLDFWQIAVWERASGKRGRVVEIARFSDGQDVRLRFSGPRDSDAWCRPVWLWRVPSPRQDAAQIAQDDWSAPSEGGGGSPHAQPWVGTIGETSSTLETPYTRYKVGDLVDGDEFEGGVVTSVETEPIYVVRWPSGYVQRAKESTLSPHRPAPVVCAPDGARCELFQEVWPTGTEGCWWVFCPKCGGRLRKENA